MFDLVSEFPEVTEQEPGPSVEVFEEAEFVVQQVKLHVFDNVESQKYQLFNYSICIIVNCELLFN